MPPIESDAIFHPAAFRGLPARKRLAPALHGIGAALLFMIVTALCLLEEHRVSREVLKQSVDAELMRTAQIAANLLDATKHAALTDPAQQNSEAYLEIVTPLKQLLEGMTNVKYIYTLRASPEGPRFVIDAAPPIDEDGDGIIDQAGLNELYDEEDASLDHALATGTASVTDEPYTDKWGTFISAYAPVRHADGRLECLVGVDIIADQYIAHLRKVDRALLSSGLLAGGASLGLGLLIFLIQRRRMFAVDSLVESEALYSQISAATPVMLWMLDAYKRPVFFSRGWLEFAGHSLDEACHAREETIHPDDRASYDSALAHAFAARRPLEIEYRVRRADGVYRWVLNRGMPRVGSKGDFLGFVGGAIDVTERHDAAERQHVALQLATRLASSSTLAEAARLVNDALQASVGYDRSAVLLYGDDGVCRFVGWQGISEAYRDAVTGHCPWPNRAKQSAPIVIEDAWTDPSLAKYVNLFRSEHIRSIVFVPVMMEGGVTGKLMLYSSEPGGIEPARLAAANTLAAYLGMAISRLTAQESLAASERRVRSVIDTALDAVILLDESWRVTDWNEQAYTVFGWSKEEAVGLPLSALIADVEHATHHEGKPRLEADGANHGTRMEIPAKRRDGRPITIELAITTIRVPGGQQYSVFARDITDAKQAEAELKRARDAAEGSNRSKSEFLANMSHEIRTPMTAILGFADLLGEEGVYAESPERRKDAITTIKKHGEALLTIINDILDLSKIEAGKLTVEVIECSIESILEEVMSLMRVRADERRLSLELVHETPIPVRVRTDPTRLKQVLINFIGNAIKFTEFGGVTVTVGCDPAAPQGPVMHFEVRDTGIGLTEEQQSRLFRAFEQADASTTRRFGGTGLGLRICERLVGLLGGEITVDSEPGVGSAFSFTIASGPLAGIEMLSPEEITARMKREETSALAVARESQPARPLDRTRILLAEDGVDNQRLIAHHLTQAGATVSLASNGRIAVEMLTRPGPGRREPIDPADFDLVLMDMQMPEMDGYSAAKHLRSIGLNLPIIALTAHAMRGDREKCVAAGCDEYVSKPIDKKHLLSTCRAMLDRRMGRTAA